MYLPFVTVQPEETAAPVILSTPTLTATVGVSYTYQVEASGLPTPTLSLLDGPPEMTLDAASGLIEWMPADEGVYTVTVQAANGIDPDAVQSFAVEVSDAPLPAACGTRAWICAGPRWSRPP